MNRASERRDTRSSAGSALALIFGINDQNIPSLRRYRNKYMLGIPAYSMELRR